MNAEISSRCENHGEKAGEAILKEGGCWMYKSLTGASAGSFAGCIVQIQASMEQSPFVSGFALAGFVRGRRCWGGVVELQKAAEL
jgi:hypothetical protein